MMISACSSATASRPSSWPARIVRSEVGVESMRRAIPRRRVSISQAAPLSEVRKMNSSSCVLAPVSKRPRRLGVGAPVGRGRAATATGAAGGRRRCARCERARRTSACCWRASELAGGEQRALWSAATDSIVARSCWATESGRREVAERHVPAAAAQARRSRPGARARHRRCRARPRCCSAPTLE